MRGEPREIENFFSYIITQDSAALIRRSAFIATPSNVCAHIGVVTRPDSRAERDSTILANKLTRRGDEKETEQIETIIIRLLIAQSLSATVLINSSLPSKLINPDYEAKGSAGFSPSFFGREPY